LTYWSRRVKTRVLVLTWAAKSVEGVAVAGLATAGRASGVRRSCGRFSVPPCPANLLSPTRPLVNPRLITNVAMPLALAALAVTCNGDLPRSR